MDRQALDVLSRRIDRLERECRAWRGAGALIAVMAVAAVVGGAATEPPGQVELERLVIKNKDGAGTITLSAANGQPSLSFASEGREKISLTIPKDGSLFLSFVEDGKDRLMLGLSRNGTPVMNFYDDNRGRRISLGVFPKVGPTISLLDEANKVIARVP
jgi:hypothetical protein